jgi:hypothetical protein
MNHTIAVFLFGCLSIGSFDLLAGDGEAEAMKDLQSMDVQTRRSAATYFEFMYRRGFPQEFSQNKETKQLVSALSKALLAAAHPMNPLDPEGCLSVYEQATWNICGT